MQGINVDTLYLSLFSLSSFKLDFDVLVKQRDGIFGAGSFFLVRDKR